MQPLTTAAVASQRNDKRAAANMLSSFDFVFESLLNPVHLEDKVASGERIVELTVNQLDSRGGRLFS